MMAVAAAVVVVVAVVAAVAVVVAEATDAMTKAPRLCTQTETSWPSMQQLTVSRSKQTRT